jgi:hypothetical protein
MRLVPTHATIMMAHPPRALRRKALLSAFFCVVSSVCYGQTHDVVCSDGYGRFEVKFATGVAVNVGPAKNGALSKRVCEARLAWDKQDLLVVPEAAQLDIDALGIDVGLDMPVVAFQVKKSDAEWLMAYQIYSLQKPPRLERTITGGDFFSAADTDLDGRIEIWAGDAGAVNGFENLALSELDFAPSIVLRFENHRLIDVSSEFRSHFDHQIAEVRARLDSHELSDFRNSDGRLPVMSHLPVEQLHRLRIAKIKILEIVWSYLYSDRELEAWNALADMWPPADFDRIRASILNAYARGIRSQLDAVSPGASRRHWKHVAHIFETAPHPDIDPDSSNVTVDIKPQAILLRLPAPPDTHAALPKSEKQVDLVIDAAGKVRSVKMAGTADKDLISPADLDLINATAVWKFIPAFKGGRAVAASMRLAVTPLR